MFCLIHSVGLNYNIYRTLSHAAAKIYNIIYINCMHKIVNNQCCQKTLSSSKAWSLTIYTKKNL